MTLGLLKPCLTCGELTSNESRCDEHERELLARQRKAFDRTRVRASNAEQGRDAAWFRLSARARKMQGFCDDCGSTEDLTADHLPQAWHRRLVLRVPIRLEDVNVVCRACNNRRGPSKPGTPRYEAWAREAGI